MAAAAAMGFWLTFPPDASWDALVHAASIREQSFDILIEAHHPLGTLLAAAAHAAAQGLGWALDPLGALRLCGAIFAGTTVGLLFAVLRRSGAAVPVALGCAVGLGGSWAFWHEASAGRVYPASALVLLVACAAFLFSSSLWIVGSLGALAILGHQQNSLLVPVFALAYVTSSGRWRSGIHRAGIYVVACGVTLAAAYLALWLASERSNPLEWVTGYVGAGFQFRGGGLLAPAVASLVGAGGTLRAVLGDLLVLGGGAWMGMAALRMAPLPAAGLRAASLTPEPARESALARATLALAAAVLWWEPQTLNFWVAVAVCGWLTVGLLSRRAPRGLGPVLLVVGLAIPIANVQRAVERSRDHGAETATRRIAAATDARDLLVVGTDILGPSLLYHGERPHATNIFAVWYRATQNGEDGAIALGRLAAETRARGGRVLVASNALEIEPSRRELVRLGTVDGGLADLFPQARLVAALQYEFPRGKERTLYEVLPDAGPRSTPAPETGTR